MRTGHGLGPSVSYPGVAASQYSVGKLTDRAELRAVLTMLPPLVGQKAGRIAVELRAKCVADWAVVLAEAC